MKIGIGLPNTVPGTEGGDMRDWAIRAEAAGFSTLGTIDRIVYGNHEPLTALAYAAAVTERIGLLTSILIAPLRPNTALLAKQAASVDVLSGGRLTLGIAVGGREDDFDAGGVEFHRRGAIFDRQLDEMQRRWKGEKVGIAGGVGPQPRDGRPEVVIGGSSAPSFRRAAQHAGWMMGGGPPDAFVEGARSCRPPGTPPVATARRARWRSATSAWATARATRSTATSPTTTPTSATSPGRWRAASRPTPTR
jgi:alkanesulfonate monooxygenase SsuD/methylene tetrahydromethanopterin reductase-like flavin-dependent oxidoreductase (luciferase family)